MKNLFFEVESRKNNSKKLFSFSLSKVMDHGEWKNKVKAPLEKYLLGKEENLKAELNIIIGS